MVERLKCATGGRMRLTCAQFISHVQSVRTTIVSCPPDECTSVPNSPMYINGDKKKYMPDKIAIIFIAARAAAQLHEIRNLTR